MSINRGSCVVCAILLIAANSSAQSVRSLLKSSARNSSDNVSSTLTLRFRSMGRKAVLELNAILLGEDQEFRYEALHYLIELHRISDTELERLAHKDTNLLIVARCYRKLLGRSDGLSIIVRSAIDVPSPGTATVAYNTICRKSKAIGYSFLHLWLRINTSRITEPELETYVKLARGFIRQAADSPLTKETLQALLPLSLRNKVRW